MGLIHRRPTVKIRYTYAAGFSGIDDAVMLAKAVQWRYPECNIILDVQLLKKESEDADEEREG